MTIYALSSGKGVSGLAVIRISGKQCKLVMKSILSGNIPKPKTATL